MADDPKPHITAIAIDGFKSFAKEQRIEISPLTIFAGANSSGKSSAMQPLLLLKQTLDATFDPGPLLLDGPHVQFTSASQFFSRVTQRTTAGKFNVVIELSNGGKLRDIFKRTGIYVDLDGTALFEDEDWIILRSEMSPEELWDALRSEAHGTGLRVSKRRLTNLQIVRARCFFDLSWDSGQRSAPLLSAYYVNLIQSIIHVPALRGNPSRAYRTAAVEDYYPGTFENYAASIVFQWQLDEDGRLLALDRYLRSLGLTSQVRSKAIDATQVELLVGRLSTDSDLVNIADVGFGVSQALPVLVALLKAKPGQLVYIEQPELHLHPRAQQALAPIFADAAKRGVQVVVETHSSILILAIQTLIAKGELSPEIVKLHWFQRDARGVTKVTTAQPDELGAYGDWPEDFGEVEAGADNDYLDAVETRAFPPKSRNAR
jgi:hypothetical protein